MTAAEPAPYFVPTADDNGVISAIVPIRPLRIALLGYRSHPFVGGQGIYLKYLSRALRAMGHHVEVISGPPYPELDDGISLIKVPSLDLYAHENHVRALRPHHLLSFTDSFEWWSMLSGGFPEPYTFGRRVVKALAACQYDIIHDNQSLSYGLLALQKSGVCVVSTIHHPIHRDRDIALAAAAKWGDRLLIKRWYSFLSMQEKVVRELNHVITVSRSSQSDIATYFSRTGERTPVIPNGIDVEVFSPRPDIARIPYRMITTASSDQPLKGLQFLLQATAALREKFPAIHCRVIGKLQDKGETQQQLERLDLGDKVSFVSGISTEELVKEYAQASLFVCPSLYEGFGLPLGEAMACGLPVVSSDGGALPEVAGKVGTLVPAANAEALASAIDEIFSQPQTIASRGSQCRQHIIDNFSWSKVARDLSTYYQRILQRAHG